MFFINEEHKDNYEDMLLRFPNARKDYQYKVGCYITSHPGLFRKAKVFIDDSPVSWAYDAIEEVIDIDLTSGEKLLVDVMLTLWNGTPGFDLNHAIGVWDESNYKVFLETLEISRGENN